MWPAEHNEGFRLNRLNWDERVEAHWTSPMYSRHADDLRAGGHCLDESILKHVGDVTGRSLVHLQCHMGMETLSWSRLGADATGVDFSAPAIKKACQLRDELGLATQFVCSNVYDAPESTGRQFDVVFVSVGSLCWLPDVRRWADVVARLLKPGGRLFLRDGHPFIDVFEQHPTEPRLEVVYPYSSDEALIFDEDGTYVETDATLKHTRTMEWMHPLGETINALIAAGLVIDALHEGTACCWQRYPMMERVDDDRWVLSGPILGALPQEMTILASKPG